MKIGFIGLGLIGGSIARGLRKKHPEYYMIATAHSEQTVAMALEEGVIDEGCSQVDERFGSCDLIFLCAPVSYNISYLEQLKSLISDRCVITDVGSTKTEIHEAATRLGLEAHFIGGHPMAGSERSGFQYSTDHLIENAWYVLTPSSQSTREQLDLCLSVVRDLNALPLVLNYQEHDSIVAAISHLPHLIAAGLVNLIHDSDSPDQIMRQVAAGGFKDITRIASSSPVMWQQICMTNGENISRFLRAYIQSMETILRDLETGDSQKIYDLFESARDYRDSIPDQSRGPLKKEYSIYCDLVDEAGAIATIATILATHQISIKNIGIIHNREFEQGVLKIEFYEESAADEADRLLTRCQYNVYKR